MYSSTGLWAAMSRQFRLMAFAAEVFDGLLFGVALDEPSAQVAANTVDIFILARLAVFLVAGIYTGTHRFCPRLCFVLRHAVLHEVRRYDLVECALALSIRFSFASYTRGPTVITGSGLSITSLTL